jgi:hypothetical protein
MRKLHLAVGILTVVTFLITGQVMRHHSPPMTALSDSVRLMYRSRHIYILGAALVNLMLGLYFEWRPQGWRRMLQSIGSVLLLISPALLVLAFALEPTSDLHADLRWSHYGLYALFAGSMLHLAGGGAQGPLMKTAGPGADHPRPDAAADGKLV